MLKKAVAIVLQRSGSKRCFSRIWKQMGKVSIYNLKHILLT